MAAVPGRLVVTAGSYGELRAAACEGHTATVQALLVSDSVYTSVDYSTALYSAACNGHLDTVRAFLADGRADPAACNSYALRLSALNGHIPVVQALLADGRADPAFNRSRALRIASREGHAHVFRALLADGRSDPEDLRDLWVCSFWTAACLLIRTAARWRRRRAWLLHAAEGTAPGK
jgi:ankyrin repeat protein